ncbi:AAA family ATPase [Candidatus Woesearchaeota archaeon]|nr:MAG: AAA family ATPase [Candidatus Woesearchaeota archaeon]
MKELELKVAEAVQDDVNKGIVRIDANLMAEISVRPGDIVELEGGRKTVGIVDRAYPGDLGLNIIRMDGILRRNAKTGIGEIIKVRKASVSAAKKVTIVPARHGIFIRAPPELFKRGLLGRAVVLGDILALGGTRRRRNIMSQSPVEDIFSMLDESMMGFNLGDIKLIVAKTDPKGPVLITQETEVIYKNEPIEEVEESKVIPDVTYEDIGGLKEEIKKIREMVEIPLKHPEIFERLGIEPPKGVLLHGPPGTGKTLLARAVASETNSNFTVINGPEIMSKYYGQSEENLRKIFEEAEKNAPSIIFIDEIDAIATKREDTKGEVERRVVAQLLALMDGLNSRGKVVVIAATNIPNALDPALRRPGRFDREIEIGVPNKDGRLNILKIHTRGMPLAKEVDLDKLAEVTYGFVGADIAALAKEAAMIVLRRVLPDLHLDKDDPIPVELLDKLRITQDDFIEALKVVRPSALREVLITVPTTTWDDIGGLDDIKQKLKEAVEWPLKQPEAFSRLGVRPPKGILLYGPPGTGKTMLAKAVANESDANFISVKGPELLSKWVGESERGIRKVFEKARQVSPTIIFFDEIDSLAPKRGGGGGDSNVTDRVVNQLLTEIDGLEEMHDVVIIGATNRPDIVDSALLRPGRFDRVLMAPVPDVEAREKIFKVHTAKMPLAQDVNIKELAAKAEGYVGADIEALCREAALHALRKNMDAKEVSLDDFEDAFKVVRPSVSKEIEEVYKSLEAHFRAQRAEEIKKKKVDYFG